NNTCGLIPIHTCASWRRTPITSGELPMLTETNKTVSRRFFEEVFGNGKLNLLDEIIAKDHVNNGPGSLPGLPTGPEGAKQLVAVCRNAFPDLRFTIDEQIAEGDKVVTRWTAN